VKPSSAPVSEDGGFPVWGIAVVCVVGAIVVVGAIIGLFFCIRHCVNEKGPSIGIATSQHDVLFDDEDDVDLTPMQNKKQKGGDEDAFI